MSAMPEAEHMTDTHPAMQQILLQGYRRMTPLQKLQKVNQLTLAVQQMALARIRTQYPADDGRTHLLRLASLRIDRDTMMAAFHWDPLAGSA